MKTKTLLLAILVNIPILGLAESPVFDSVFYNKTLRIDYIHGGTDSSEFYALDEMLEEPHWGGSYTNLIDTLEYGHYFFKVNDKATGKTLYSRGYSSLFREWQTTSEADTVSRAFYETIVFPYPKKPVEVLFYSRDSMNRFQKSFSLDVNPDSYFIRPQDRLEYPAFDVMSNGHSSENVDVAIIPEGYTKAEMGRFIEDCNRFADELFLFEPYTQNKGNFNIYGVLAPSAENGSDVPGEEMYRSTLLNSSFYTFDSERYCMTTDNKRVRDVASNVPYDQIYILVNTEKYGGGAIYNHYNVSVNSNEHSARIFVHEFGHGFAGLGDEYYTSSVAYNDFFSLEAEPWEPNLTTLTDFNGKWEKLIPEGTPIPTPDTGKYVNQLGVFEGGGYVAKGVYRPSSDCLMNSLSAEEFCGACKQSIQHMIDFYTGK
ncbi:MAG: M64 family metallopeptidase [Bacteroidota bacterium]